MAGKPAQTHKKHYIETNVRDLAIERLTHVFERYDQIVVNFSGGKDSTACLNLALEVARETKRLPLTVISFDEEAIPPETVEYMARVAAHPDIRFHWYCVPLEHRNACSSVESYWYPWEPEARDRWVRELPPQAITEYPGFRRGSIGDQIPALFPLTKGTLASVLGVRADESLSRYHAIATKTGRFAFMTHTPVGTKVYPIYDWTVSDVWTAPAAYGWDYNRAYDVMEAAGVTRSDQRCAPPYGEQSMRRLWTYKLCWPDLWSKMILRVDGAATAARYSRTELYGTAVGSEDLPPGQTWRRWTMETLRALPESNRREAAYAIRVCLSSHASQSGGAPVPDAEPHPLSGFCWKTLFIAAKAGGNKFDRQQQKMYNRAIKERKSRNIRQR